MRDLIFTVVASLSAGIILAIMGFQSALASGRLSDSDAPNIHDHQALFALIGALACAFLAGACAEAAFIMSGTAP